VELAIPAGLIAVLGFIGWVFKDLLMYPLLRLAYENVKPGSQALSARAACARSSGPVATCESEASFGMLCESHRSGDYCGTEVEIVSAEGMQVIVTTPKQRGN